MPNHGTASKYSAGCRCDSCRKASSAVHLANRYKLRAQRVLDPDTGRLIHPTATHGTLHGYQHYSCRCQPCIRANTVALFYGRHAGDS